MLRTLLKNACSLALFSVFCALPAACTFAPPAEPLSETMSVVLENARDGRVASATATADGAGRVLVHGADGVVLFERQLPLTITALCWTARGELLAFGYQLQRYRFGGNLTQRLYRLTAADTEAITLADVTIRPETATRFAANSAPLLQAVFAPMGDELVFVRLHDPPAMPGYLQLVHRNWQAGFERELVRLPLAAVQLSWGDNDELTVTTAEAGVQFLALWRQPLNLRSRPVQPGAAFDSPEIYDERRWTLRRWRYQGLITPDEYLHLLLEELP